jgi:catechol 2,3-dioxygenase-like lactoylglutathione lyase family enzyme
MAQSPYALAEQQLVLEIYVKSVPRSIDFYTSLGFRLAWQVPGYFAQLTWDSCLLFLKSSSDDPIVAKSTSKGNIRIMIPDVDAKYEECKELGYKVSQELVDRKFVLRDFIVLDPDGWEVRFGSFLPRRGRLEQEGPEHELVVRNQKG